MDRFYTGLHIIQHAHRFARSMISVNVLRRRKSDIRVNEWVMDSAAFSQIAQHGRFLMTTEEYAEQVRRWSRCGTLVAAVSRDWMCERAMIERTGLSIEEHQERTVDEYTRLLPMIGPTYLMPVLQGYAPDDYVAHLRSYGSLLPHGAWIGVGSVCKRNGRPDAIVGVLEAIHHARPDLRLHGFGVKVTALSDPRVRSLLYSADSMAWSFAARRAGRDANDWREADAFRMRVESVASQPSQPSLWQVI